MRKPTWNGRRAPALLLLGGAAVAQPVPVPAPLPPAVRAEDRAAFEALPPETQHLCCRLETPADLDLLRRFPMLRCAALKGGPGVGPGGPAGPDRWADPPADALAPLARLPALEELYLPESMCLRPEHLRPLRALPRLRTVALTGPQVPVVPGLVDELGMLAHLRDLRLCRVDLTADFVERLARLPLERLELAACPLDEALVTELAGMRTLHSLLLQGLDSAAASALGPLAALPELRELTIEHSELNDAALAALPPRLVRLELTGCAGLTAMGIGALRALGSLRELVLVEPLDDQGLDVARPEIGDGVADVLGALRLTALDYDGVLTPALGEALGVAPDLAALTLRLHDVPDLRPIARAPRLRRLRLECAEARGSGPPFELGIDQLSPVRRCAQLQELQFVDIEIDRAAVQRVLGPRVQVTAGPSR